MSLAFGGALWHRVSKISGSSIICGELQEQQKQQGISTTTGENECAEQSLRRRDDTDGGCEHRVSDRSRAEMARAHEQCSYSKAPVFHIVQAEANITTGPQSSLACGASKACGAVNIITVSGLDTRWRDARWTRRRAQFLSSERNCEGVSACREGLRRCLPRMQSRCPGTAECMEATGR